MEDIQRKTNFYSDAELKCLGFLFIGENVKIHKSVCFSNINKISINNNVQINAFCIIRGNIELEEGVIVGEYSIISAQKGKIYIKQNVCIYQRVVIELSNNEENQVIVINERTIIETQCIITRSICNDTNLIIPMLSIV